MPMLGVRSEMDLGRDKTEGTCLGKALGRTRFLTLIPRAAKNLFTNGLPSKTEVSLALKSVPGTQKRDLNRLGISPEAVMRYVNELRSDRKFYSGFFAKIDSAREIEPRIGGIPPLYTLEFIYAIVRYTQPEALVETGVGAGGITLFILKALRTNDKGKLYSIDLPGFDREFYPSIGKHYHIHVPNGWETGWLVPPELRSRWALILGDAKLELPRLLARLKSIDFFLHDSLHTYEHMMFEYCLAYMYSRDGACLISHDVIRYWSLAFVEFCDAKGLHFALVDGILGMTKVQRPVGNNR